MMFELWYPILICLYLDSLWFPNRSFPVLHFTPWKGRHLSMSGISPQLVTRFWQNFKGRFLVPSITDANCHGNICSVNICPDNNCPYQEYLSCYWTDFDETLKASSWEHLEQIPTVTGTFVQASFVLAKFVHVRNISAVCAPILTKL